MEVVEQEQVLEPEREEEIETEEETPPDADAAGESRPRLDSIVESVLFAAGTPLPLRRLVEILGGPTAKEIKASIERLRAEYEGRRGGIQLAAVAGGFQFRTAPENAEWVRALLRERPARLGRAALETLAIVAYKQPATRAEIEAIRGVDADSAIGTLLAKRLIKIAGRKEAVGRPLMYATTEEFLEIFGLKDVNELPALKEIGPVAEPDDETTEEDDDSRGAFAEDPEPRRSEFEAGGGGPDPGGAGDGERPRGEGAGDEGGPEAGPDHG
jgi:segregation and condensation protein B